MLLPLSQAASMEEPKWLYVTLICFLICSTLITLVYKLLFNHMRAAGGSRRKLLPPSPPAARPFFGHLHLLENPLHRTLHKLSLKHGPIFSLRFGSRLAVVVSSPAAVKECFTKNDASFANRPHLTLNRHLGYNYTALVSTSYGDHWRNLRRLCSLEIFSPGRLNAFLPTREEEVKQLLSSLYKMSSSSTGGFTTVKLRSKICELTFNNITNMVAGKRYYGTKAAGTLQDKEEAMQFQVLMGNAFKFSGASNAGDFLPLLRWIDYKGIEKRMSIISKKMDRFLQGLINECRQCNGNHTMVDHLLSLQQSQPENYSDEIIKGIALNMITGGTNTSETTLEWAISLLVNHPEVLKKARDEIDTHVGFDRFIREEDLSKLRYLNGIVSETFRLFPPLPLILPHESSEDCKLGGYDVPRGTIILVNAWAIHRDPEVWDEPNCYRPERFLKVEGSQDELLMLQFGMGRRVCPGAELGQRVVGLALGSLIQSFEWERLAGEEQVDLAEGTGLTLSKANPLVIMCKPRQVMDKVFKNMMI